MANLYRGSLVEINRAWADFSLWGMLDLSSKSTCGGGLQVYNAPVCPDRQSTGLQAS